MSSKKGRYPTLAPMERARVYLRYLPLHLHLSHRSGQTFAPVSPHLTGEQQFTLDSCQTGLRHRLSIYCTEYCGVLMITALRQLEVGVCVCDSSAN